MGLSELIRLFDCILMGDPTPAYLPFSVQSQFILVTDRHFCFWCISKSNIVVPAENDHG
jgi:hypothetical protein